MNTSQGEKKQTNDASDENRDNSDAAATRRGIARGWKPLF